MKINWCKFGFHDWEKKEEQFGNIRKCKKCPVRQVFGEYLATGMSSGGDWFRLDKEKK